jgi:AraC family transcriptional regulator
MAPRAEDFDVVILGSGQGGATPMRSGGLAAWQAKLALEYIENNLGSKVTVGDLADWVSLSKSHFSRAFKQTLGASPMSYVAARRLQRAALMMTSTREGLGSIALACGFADQSHLNRYFRRVVGTSPGRWRRMSAIRPGCSYDSSSASRPACHAPSERARVLPASPHNEV